jgi:hypothetical protein
VARGAAIGGRNTALYLSAPQWIRTTDLVLLLAGCVTVPPVVLAPLALRASGTLNAGRGAKARRARRRVRRLGLREAATAYRAAYTARIATGSYDSSGLLLVRVMREGARAAPVG